MLHDAGDTKLCSSGSLDQPKKKGTLKLFGTKRNYNKTFLLNECRRNIYFKIH